MHSSFDQAAGLVGDGESWRVTTQVVNERLFDSGCWVIKKRGEHVVYEWSIYDMCRKRFF